MRVSSFANKKAAPTHVFLLEIWFDWKEDQVWKYLSHFQTKRMLVRQWLFFHWTQQSKLQNWFVLCFGKYLNSSIDHHRIEIWKHCLRNEKWEKWSMKSQKKETCFDQFQELQYRHYQILWQLLIQTCNEKIVKLLWKKHKRDMTRKDTKKNLSPWKTVVGERSSSQETIVDIRPHDFD
jgi:hypothetical protein